MNSYIIPILIAALGVALMLQYKRHSPAPPEIKIPTPVSTSWAQKQNTPIQSLNYSKRMAANTLALPSTKLNPVFDKPYAYFQEELIRLNTCLRKKSCHFPKSDPRAYESAVYSEMVRTLKTLSSWQNRNAYQDERIPDLMSLFLEFDNPYVKIEALKVMHSQIFSQNHLQAILEDVIRYPHPEPIADGMKELKRYTSSSDKRKIDGTISKVLLHGSIHAAVEVAKNLQPLITSQNRPFYKGVLMKLENDPLNEEIYEELEKALN